MATVLVIAEQAKGVLKKASFNALGAGQDLAKRLGGAQVHALVIGQGVGDAAKQLAESANAVHVADGAAFANPLAETHAAAAIAAAKAISATHIVIVASTYGKDMAPRVAARLGAGIASDVLSFTGEGNVHFKRAMWAGNAVATVEVTTAIKVVTIRGTEFPAGAKGLNGSVAALAADGGAPKTKFLEFNEVKSARPELTEARVVVSGGRGTKGDFKPIEQLADVLGAAVGASRAVCDAGWQPNDLQVGQTGKVVAPQLYIAAGSSGAIQHLAGMKGSKTIVAVNKDPEAPIFQVADYGLVDDLFKALPQLSEAAAKLK
ncbi:MAG: electron transfer flavoprotein subunit alpha/FixB family protein [Deltaproteobacteria bacterium]|nr:electron transfer flavoprotein subunit alpha/FixB family protein [Deltaproteobacteria bacterium]